MSGLAGRIEELDGRGHIAGAELVALTAELLSAAGMDGDRAAEAAELLVECQRTGIESHGVAHLPVYIRRMISGAIDPMAIPVVTNSDLAIAVMDGRNALGVVVGLAALDEACRRARQFGVGACAVRDSNHFGAAAPLVGRAARSGLIALAFSNAAPTMAAWGGSEAILGTNPMAAAFPRAERDPVIVDMATSAVARGKIRQAALRNEAIPAGWALDSSGRPTTDAEAALDGTVQPLGGAKGYALTLAVELLCTALSGGRPGFEVRNPHDPAVAAAGTSHLFLAFDPSHFGGLDAAHSAVGRLGIRIEESKPAAEGAAPRLPGARASAMAASHAKSGIPLTPQLIAYLRDSVRQLTDTGLRV